MSLSQEPAYSELRNHFVCGYRNIIGEKYAGNSGSHGMRGNAVDTTNGAGPHNIQMFIMNPDGTVVHCLPGYWNPNDLSQELQLALQLNRLYENKSISSAEKILAFNNMQKNHIRMHSPDMVARSKLQSFDMKFEATHRHGKSDLIRNAALLDGSWGPGSDAAFKTTDELIHERMSSRPFVQYGAFDVAAFADYGQPTYDKHEDSLDELGRMTGEHDIHWIKSGKAKPPMAACSTAGKRSGKVYVRTYGKVRKASAK